MLGHSGQGVIIELGERPILARNANNEWKSVRFPSGATQRNYRKLHILDRELEIDNWKSHLAAVANFGDSRLTGENLVTVLKNLGPNSTAKKGAKFHSVTDIGYTNATLAAYANLCGVSFEDLEKLHSLREALFNLWYRGMPDFMLRCGQVALKSTLSRARGYLRDNYGVTIKDYVHNQICDRIDVLPVTTNRDPTSALPFTSQYAPALRRAGLLLGCQLLCKLGQRLETTKEADSRADGSSPYSLEANKLRFHFRPEEVKKTNGGDARGFVLLTRAEIPTARNMVQDGTFYTTALDIIRAGNDAIESKKKKPTKNDTESDFNVRNEFTKNSFRRTFAIHILCNSKPANPVPAVVNLHGAWRGKSSRIKHYGRDSAAWTDSLIKLEGISHLFF